MPGVLAVRFSPAEARDSKSPADVEDAEGETRSVVEPPFTDPQPEAAGVLVGNVRFVRSLPTSCSVAAELVISAGWKEGDDGSLDTASSVSSRRGELSGDRRRGGDRSFREAEGNNEDVEREKEGNEELSPV